MACLRCGSAWVSKKGKDKASCPECCKQQRHKARTQGRLPAAVQKTCRRCGVAFEVTGSGITHRVFCEACIKPARAERLRAYKAAVSKGERTPIAPPPRVERKCCWCGKTLTEGQHRYCGKNCYFAARDAGAQSWDRTRQVEGAWHRGGRYACAPSRKPLHECLTNMHSFLRNARNLWARGARKRNACEICGNECKQWFGHGRFCSRECLRQNRHAVPCFKCGKECVARGVCGRRLCDQCRAEAKAASRKQLKREVGSYQKKCRKYGGHYNSRVRRQQVFERDNWVCHVCKCKTKRTLYNHPRQATVDHHPVPLSHGGDHDWHNVRCACRKCNTEKSNKWDGQRRLRLILS